MTISQAAKIEFHFILLKMRNDLREMEKEYEEPVKMYSANEILAMIPDSPEDARRIRADRKYHREYMKKRYDNLKNIQP